MYNLDKHKLHLFFKIIGIILWPDLSTTIGLIVSQFCTDIHDTQKVIPPTEVDVCLSNIPVIKRNLAY